ncbi:MAG TPA: putative zinc-binding metallopeptidase [Ilumatobacteraceae bacterium]
MRTFHCERCGAVVPFTAQQCKTCDASLAYITSEHTIRVLGATSDPGVYRLNGRGERFWRCLNAAWGCNWLIATTSDTPWCRSCALTRGRPDDARPDAMDAWMAAEAAKRRLLHQLDELALPIEVRSPAAPHGLVFDLVHVPGENAITGHLDGVITLDLTETDDRHREELRCWLGEPFRTVIGHLRHEIGHYYWGRLVGQTDQLSAFRRLFGDERADYPTAIDDHYATADRSWDHGRFATPYAASHPLEDWAETFAQYLHISDAIDTAIAHELVAPARAQAIISQPPSHRDLVTMLDAWRPINAAVNAIAEALGMPMVYPFEPTGTVIAKLEFVARQISAHVRRDRFYGAFGPSH